MRIEFDPAKDATNRAKHGVSLMQTLALDWESALARVDDRRDYGETRMLAFVEHGGTLYHVVFVERGPAKRIISLRRANRREVKKYVWKTQAPQAHHADVG